MTNGISPTVRIWNNLKLTVQSSYNKMIEYDKYLQTHQRDIGVDEIQNFIRVLQGDLNNVQNQLPSLNTPTMTQPNNIQSESKEYKNIKLSEKQLHRVIKESVEKILRESELNELDPRTYASYAQKRAAQGQMDKAQSGRQAAVQAFNKKFGYDSDFDYNKYHRMMDNQYNVHDNNYVNGNVMDGIYNSSDGTSKYTEKQGNRIIRRGASSPSDEPAWTHTIQDEIPFSIARQMAQNNGQYIKGQGWQ